MEFGIFCPELLNKLLTYTSGGQIYYKGMNVPLENEESYFNSGDYIGILTDIQ